MGLIKTIFGTYSSRQLKKIEPVCQAVEALYDKYKNMKDEELKNTTAVLKQRLAEGEDLDDILPDAYAAVSEAFARVLHKRLFRVQIFGGIILHQGRIAEMKTGEGKTLVAALPAYLNALEGKGVHIVTVNDYLARYGREFIGKVYNFLGLEVGLVVNDEQYRNKTQDEKKKERQQAYKADITYGTNNEMGFDYLRDNMVTYKDEMVQRGHHFAIVDEVDSILIDEARTPLIISGEGEKSTDLYEKADKLVKRLKVFKIKEIEKKKEYEDVSEDYIVDEKAKTAVLTKNGIKKAEDYFNIENISDAENAEIFHHVNIALRAYGIMEKDVDYTKQNNEIIIIDTFTGRLMPGRRFNDGLHQAIEAKENVKIKRESKTLATITFQNYFRLYDKLSGMTGTAMTEDDEFREIYKLDVVEIPTDKPMIRTNHNDVVYTTVRAKYKAIVEQIKECNAKGQPVLVGTVSVEKSEYLSNLLKKEGVKHNILNAVHHKEEAEIIAQAGRLGKVTISTNMAGRGTDIILGGNAEYMAKIDMRKKLTESYEFDPDSERGRELINEVKKEMRIEINNDAEYEMIQLIDPETNEKKYTTSEIEDIIDEMRYEEQKQRVLDNKDTERILKSSLNMEKNNKIVMALDYIKEEIEKVSNIRNYTINDIEKILKTSMSDVKIKFFKMENEKNEIDNARKKLKDWENAEVENKTYSKAEIEEIIKIAFNDQEIKKFAEKNQMLIEKIRREAIIDLPLTEDKMKRILNARQYVIDEIEKNDLEEAKRKLSERSINETGLKKYTNSEIEKILDITLTEEKMKKIIEGKKDYRLQLEKLMQGKGKDYIISSAIAKDIDNIIMNASSFFDTDDEEILNSRKQYAELIKKHENELESGQEREKVLKAGGLYVLGTERHESRRIDNQLRGRSGRQGDPGESRFFLSLEDDLMRLFGSDRFMGMAARLGEDIPIDAKILSNTIETAQKRIESNNFERRKNVLRYDDVMNQQRKTIYSQRREVLDGEDLKNKILSMIHDVIEDAVDNYCSAKDASEWNFNGLREHFKEYLLTTDEDFVFENDQEKENSDIDEIKEMLIQRAINKYDETEKIFDNYYGKENNVMREKEREILLRNVDINWMEHIDAMSDMRESIGLRAYAQRDPIIEYRIEGSAMFDGIIQNIKEATVREIMNATPSTELIQRKQVVRIKETSVGGTVQNSVSSKPAIENKSQTIVKKEKVGRNDPCPCGSGKKYKKCCGANSNADD